MARRGTVEWALRSRVRALTKSRLTPVKLALYRQRQAVRRLDRKLQPKPRATPPSLPVAKEEAILRWMFDDAHRAEP